MLTSPDNLWSPGTGTEFKPAIDLGAMQQSVQDAMLRRALVVRGTPAERALLAPRYWDFWIDIDNNSYMWVGGISNNWRRFSGAISHTPAPWDFISDTFVGRTLTVTLPTRLENNESLMVTTAGMGTGYGNVSLSSAVNNTSGGLDVTVRQMQWGSQTQNGCRWLWQITRGVA